MAVTGLATVSGLAIWLVVLGAALLTRDPALGLVALLLLFGQIVVVPLGLGLLDPAGPVERSLLIGARVGFRFAAVAAVMALAVSPGPISAAIGALYLLPALAVAVAAVVRLPGSIQRRDAWHASELARTAASGFLAVGALAFVLHRAGDPVLGFGEPILQLTAVHFHFSGFGLLLMAGAAARRRSRVGAAAVRLLVAGMLVTPIGFLASGIVQLVGALLVVAGLLATAMAAIGRSGWLTVSAAASFVVAVLGAVYAGSEALGSPILAIGTMAAVHGVAAAFGVVFAGLVGWRLAPAPR